MQIKFQRATYQDIDFLDNLHTACMKPHVMKVYPWKPNLFRQTFNPELIEIILLDQVVVGMVQIVNQADEIYLANLLICPEFQNRGIGSTVLQHLINQAEMLALPMKLQVLKKNPAQKLYERFGFVVMETTKTHYIMIRANRI